MTGTQCSQIGHPRNAGERPGGVPIVLTADRTLMSYYRVLLDGMLASSQTTAYPDFVISKVLLPRAPHPGGQCLVAPLGLRRIEAALLAGGVTPEQLAVVDDAHLTQVIGPQTKIVAISSGEPLGRGMNSSTMTGVAGGRIYPEVMFERLLRKVRELLNERAPEAMIILGGPGAWQVANDPEQRAALGISHVVRGYAEGNAAAIFADLLAGRDLPPIIAGKCPPGNEIPPIAGASTMGVVEISRGCGLGCDFCTLGRVTMQHLSRQTILEDVETNLRAGLSSVAILSEDLLRYGGTGLHCQPRALLSLLGLLRTLPGLRLLQPDHVNVTSIAQYDDAQLAELQWLLTGGYQRLPWVNVGIETASGRLLQANGGRPKMTGVSAEGWGEFCALQLRRLIKAGFVPMASLVIALPGETTEEAEQTLDWVRGFSGEAITIFPVVYAPLHGPAPDTRNLSPVQWQLMREAYEFNFKWVPRLYWDSQVGAGVGVARRLMIQMLGKGNVHMWRHFLAAHARRT